MSRRHTVLGAAFLSVVGAGCFGSHADGGCPFPAGALPRDTLSGPVGAQIPIDSFVLVVQENRSFDHYFSQLPASGQPDVDVPSPLFTNPDESRGGFPVLPAAAPSMCLGDIAHDWYSVHRQVNGGAMDGFVDVANPGGARALATYDEHTLPFYYALANTFSISDRYFASVQGPTWPNRQYLFAASSHGWFRTAPIEERDSVRTVFHELDDAGVSWAVYSDKDTFEAHMYPKLAHDDAAHFKTLGDFANDAAAGTLPGFAVVDSDYEGASRDGTDEHAPSDVQIGQRWVFHVVDAVLKSPAWPHTALFFTYDEHGGFFDHVAPPPACEPEDVAPRRSQQELARFDTLGVRVPLIVVSPFAKRHYVSHNVASHTSILRMVEARFDLPALSRRDANDTPPYDMFDFADPPFQSPPRFVAPTVDPDAFNACRAINAGSGDSD